MDISTITIAHDFPEVVLNTMESIQRHMSKRNLIIVDEAGWDKFKNLPFKFKHKGFYHNHIRSPYRNAALGLQYLYAIWPNCDWYIYIEYDCLVLNDSFKEDLIQAEKDGIWALGNELTSHDFDLPLLEKIVNQKSFDAVYHFGGFCQFFHHDFMKCLDDIDFFNRFLWETKDFKSGDFPRLNPTIPCFEEELFATLAGNLGGHDKLRELAAWEGLFCFTSNGAVETNKHRGNWAKYPMRFRPEITSEDITDKASIIHPVKAGNPLRLTVPLHNNQEAIL